MIDILLVLQATYIFNAKITEQLQIAQYHNDDEASTGLWLYVKEWKNSAIRDS